MRALVLVSLLLAAPALAETVAVRRLALLVGVNDGGAERVRLRYAGSDARSFDKVLGELGGVAPADRRLVLDVGCAGLLEALGELRARAQAARTSGASRVEVLLYYSGHSDEEGLLLKGERLDHGELRRALEALPADVRIAVLDSCASGAFARAKGGTRRPAFLVDSGNKVKGHAILTSSSEDEISQESDRLGGSYFTHHLLSGLRATSAGLYLAEALEGRLFVRDEAGNLVVEVEKLAGRPTELGLAQFQGLALEATVARGGGAVPFQARRQCQQRLGMSTTTVQYWPGVQLGVRI